MNYQTPRKDDRRGGSMGKFSNKKDMDGWMTPNIKNSRVQQQTFDIGKVKTVSVSYSLCFVCQFFNLSEILPRF